MCFNVKAPLLSSFPLSTDRYFYFYHSLTTPILSHHLPPFYKHSLYLNFPSGRISYSIIVLQKLPLPHHGLNWSCFWKEKILLHRSVTHLPAAVPAMVSIFPLSSIHLFYNVPNLAAAPPLRTPFALRFLLVFRETSVVWFRLPRCTARLLGLALPFRFSCLPFFFCHFFLYRLILCLDCLPGLSPSFYSLLAVLCPFSSYISWSLFFLCVCVTLMSIMDWIPHTHPISLYLVWFLQAWHFCF